MQQTTVQLGAMAIALRRAHEEATLDFSNCCHCGGDRELKSSAKVAYGSLEYC